MTLEIAPILCCLCGAVTKGRTDRYNLNAGSRRRVYGLKKTQKQCRKCYKGKHMKKLNIKGLKNSNGKTKTNYEVTKDKNLVNSFSRYRQRRGHIDFVYYATKRWAGDNHRSKDFVDLGAFKQWAINDHHYNDLFDAWVEADYDDYFSPAVTRYKFTEPYAIGKMYWKPKGAIGISKQQKGARLQMKQVIAEINAMQYSAKNDKESTVEEQEAFAKAYQEQREINARARGVTLRR